MNLRPEYTGIASYSENFEQGRYYPQQYECILQKKAPLRAQRDLNTKLTLKLNL